jgi:putative ABC transport system permease protein
MSGVLARASLRYGLRHPWQLILAALGVALGVAVVTAIDLTRASASRSFDDATESVLGRSTHQIVGGPQGLDEQVYVRLRRSGVVADLAPVIDAHLRIADGQGRSLRLLGVDPLVEASVRGYWQAAGQAPIDVIGLMTRPNTVLLSALAAERLGVARGEQVSVSLPSGPARLDVLGVLEAGDRYPALAGTELAIADLATAQELLDMAGRLSRIDLILRSADQVARVEGLLEPGTRLIRASTRSESAANMTRAFHTNLMALSLLALLVGMFLIYNSQTFMVIQRREQFGVLRALGVRRRQLAGLVLGEAAVLGVIGTAAGLFLGWLLARALIGLVTQTINDLYYSLSVTGVTLDAFALGKGVVLGIGGSLLAALMPAGEATRVEPRAAMSRAELEGRAGAAAGAAFRLGIGAVGLGALVFLVPSRQVWIGLLALFLVVVGFALMSPAITVGIASLLQRLRPVRRHLTARLALRGVTASLSRTGVAVAALMLAVAHTIGIGVMVGSFRLSVNDWLSTLLRADYYLSIPASPAEGGRASLTTDAIAELARIPGVDRLSHVRHVELVTERGVETVTAYALNEFAREGFRFLDSLSPRTFWQRFETDDVVMVSEPYAYHHQIGPGQHLSLPTRGSERDFEVIAVYQDYARDRGTIAMSRATYDRHWDDPGVDGIGVYTGSGFDLETLQQRVAQLAGATAGVEVVSNRALREESLRVFDRTFTITEVLRLLAGVIAFIGVFSALLAIQLERRRELGILKAIGVAPGQIRRVVLGETAVMGGAAGLLAIPAGLVMSMLLIYVINRRSFGWTMDLALTPGEILAGFALALVAALLAGIYPAARMARVQPAVALRQE